MPETKMQNKIILDRAKAAALSHDYPLAARLYKGLLGSDPENVEFLKGLGDVYERSSQDASAIPLYREVIRLSPSDVDALNRLAGIYRRLRRYDDSISMLEQALITDENNVQVYYNLGFTYKLMGKYDDAIECFNRVIEQNPSDVLTYNHLGSIYDARQEFPKAVAAYQRGLKVDPNHPILHLNLAHAYESQEQLEFAEKEYEAALRTKPGWLEAIDGYAGLLLRKDDSRNAGALVQQAIRLNPQNVKLHTTMGDVYSGQQMFRQAEDEYREALKYDENYAEALAGLANAYEATGKTADALRTAQRLEKTQPESIPAQQEYSYHLLSSDKLNAASRKIKQLWDRNPEDVRTLNLLAQYYICKGEDSKANGCFRKIEAINPQYTTHLRDAADRYHQKGRYKKAEDYYLRYLESHTNDAVSMLKLARNYEKLALYDKALAYYQMLHARDESNKVYAEHVSRVSALCLGAGSAEAVPLDAPEPVAPEPNPAVPPSHESEAEPFDDDIAPVIEDDDEALSVSRLSELATDTADARDVIDSDELDDLGIDDTQGVDLDDLVTDKDGDFFEENPFGATGAVLPAQEENMGGVFQPEVVEEAEDIELPSPKRSAPPAAAVTDAFEDDFTIDDLPSTPPAAEAEERPSVMHVAITASPEKPAEFDVPLVEGAYIEEEEVLDAPPEPAESDVPLVEGAYIEEEVLDAPPEPAESDVPLAEGAFVEEEVLDAPPEPAESDVPLAEGAYIEEKVLDAPPAADGAFPVDDAGLYAASSPLASGGEGEPWSEEKMRAAAELFQSLKSLIAYLPEEKRGEFMANRTSLVLDYLISRLSGNDGLLARSSRLRSTLGLPDGASGKSSGAALATRVLSGMEQYVASLPDGEQARNLEGELFSLMQRLQRDDA